MQPGSPTFRRRALAVVVFAVAMGYLESACVIYLQRAIGVTPAHLFPAMDAQRLQGLLGIEIGREVATLVMLAAIGGIVGGTRLERLAWTSVAFGVWDIAYYLWLAVCIGWPTSPGTWDLLFLVPAPWSGPVAAPVLVSCALIGFGLAAGRRQFLGRSARLTRGEWAALVAGGLIVLSAFLWNASLVAAQGIPTRFPWWLFIAGLALGCTAALRALRHSRAACSRSR